MSDSVAEEEQQEVINLEEIIRDAQFQEEQVQEDMFQNMYKSGLARSKENILCQELTNTYPHFEVTKGLLD